MVSIGFECFAGRGLYGGPRNARAEAVDFVNGTAPVGARVLLDEPPLGMLDSATVDGARFRVRRSTSARRLAPEDFDYVLGAGELSRVPAIERRVFDGPGYFGLPTRYVVARVDPAARRSRPPGEKEDDETPARSDEPDE